MVYLSPISTLIRHGLCTKRQETYLLFAIQVKLLSEDLRFSGDRRIGVHCWSPMPPAPETELREDIVISDPI
jgi:hypothetical protein